MTNKEFYLDELVTIAIYDGNRIALSPESGKPISCYNLDCNNCGFNSSYGEHCSLNRKRWLDAEYVEPPKLTKAERYYCKALQPESVITRSMYGDIAITSGDYYAIPNLRVFNDVKFSFIKKDENWKVEDLLKLEVVDDD